MFKTKYYTNGTDIVEAHPAHLPDHPDAIELKFTSASETINYTATCENVFKAMQKIMRFLGAIYDVSDDPTTLKFIS